MVADCPLCGFTAHDLREEIEHMSQNHPDVIVERLRNAGMHEVAASFELRGPPSYPYADGDTIVIGPEAFSDKGETVISWKGRNYRLES